MNSSSVRNQAVAAICQEFSRWTDTHQELTPACSRRCTACCTENVTITAMEGERILDYIIEDDDRVNWFAATLDNALAGRRGIIAPSCTTNEFARACFAKEEVDQDLPASSSICPFLADDLCQIYTVRPFGCQLFLSQHRCNADSPATIPGFYLDAATACSQMIEHLGQKEYWGNMVDVLAALLDISKYQAIASQLEMRSPGSLLQAKMRVLAASPLPGFLIEERHFAAIEPLFKAIFAHTISGITVEDILNGHRC